MGYFIPKRFAFSEKAEMGLGVCVVCHFSIENGWP